MDEMADEQLENIKIKKEFLEENNDSFDPSTVEDSINTKHEPPNMFQHYDNNESKPDDTPLKSSKEPFPCDESLFESSTEDGKLNHLGELTQMGLNFLVCCLHLLLDSDPSITLDWIEKNGKLDIDSKTNVLKIIDNWIATVKSTEKEIDFGHRKKGKSKKRISLDTLAKLEFVKNQCGKHTQVAMAKTLNIETVTIYKWVQKYGIKFSMREGDCYFCDQGCDKIMCKLDKNVDFVKKEIVKKQYEEALELVKNQCGNHSVPAMSKVLKINKQTIFKWMKIHNIIFSQHNGTCHFCENKKATENDNINENFQLKKSQYDYDFMNKSQNYIGESYEDETVNPANLLEVKSEKYSGYPDEEMLDDTNAYNDYFSQNPYEFMKVEKEESAEPVLEEDNVDMNDYDNDYDEKIDQDFENKTVQKSSKNNDSSTEKQTPSKWKWAMITDETIESVKNQCGDHSINEMARMLNVSQKTLGRYMKRFVIKSTNQPLELCKFCDIRKSSNLKYNCRHCDYSTSSEIAFKKHSLKVHNEKKPISCEFCGNTYSKKSALESHVAVIHEKKKIMCDLCGEKYTSASTLKTHIQCVHGDKRPYVCENCGKGFKDKRLLRRHLKAVHEGKRPYKCTTCAASFQFKPVLKNHIRAVHEGLKPHLCPICGVSFADKGNLTKHVAAVHEGKKASMKKIDPISL